MTNYVPIRGEYASNRVDMFWLMYHPGWIKLWIKVDGVRRQISVGPTEP